MSEIKNICEVAAKSIIRLPEQPDILFSEENNKIMLRSDYGESEKLLICEGGNKEQLYELFIALLMQYAIEFIPQTKKK